MKYIEPLSRLIAAFSKLPSVGEKTAARYAYAVLNSSDEDVEELANAIATGDAALNERIDSVNAALNAAKAAFFTRG